jgi:hypothetical protein
MSGGIAHTRSARGCNTCRKAPHKAHLRREYGLKCYLIGNSRSSLIATSLHFLKKEKKEANMATVSMTMTETQTHTCDANTRGT